MSLIEKRLAELDQEKARLLLSLADQRSRKTFMCVCGARHAIRRCDALLDHWYQKGQGYEDGQWTPACLYVVCPVTDVKNRLLFDTSKVDYSRCQHYDWSAEKQFIRLYSRLFKTYTLDYKTDKRVWTNNFYFDQNRKKFGLKIEGIDAHDKAYQ